ncbi:MAG: glycosyltransferase family 2 protein [Cyclobacteriaceae bacterium]
MSSAKVCAVIVTYNGMKWIEKCVDSIVRSTVETDILVVDNGSKDGTFEYLEKTGVCKFLFRSSINLGFGKANNLALRKGHSLGYEYFLLLNQDAWVEESMVDHLIASLQAETHYGIASPLHYNGSGTSFDSFFESYLSRTNSYQEDLKTNSVRNRLYESPFINAACWMLNRNTLEEVGLFHPLFDHYGEDDNYIDRLHQKGLKLGLDPKVKVYHDREDIAVNPLKNDPGRLFKRSTLRSLLHPEHNESWKTDFKKARKTAKKLSREMSGVFKIIFRIKCLLKFFYTYRDVKSFKKKRKSELSIH